MASYSEAESHLVSETDLEYFMSSKAQELFEICDKEKKGYITKCDMHRLQDELPLSAEQLEVVYDTLDEDGDARLSLKEFTEGFGSYLGLQKCADQKPSPLRPRKGSIYEGGMQDSPGGQFQEMLQQLGANGVFEDQETIKAMWERLKADDPSLLNPFENFLSEISSEISRSHAEYTTIEAALRSKSNAHDEEVSKLYEEMENQIQQEKEKILMQEKVKERQLRLEMEKELAARDSQLHELLKRHQELESKLGELNMSEVETKHENELLHQDKHELMQLLEQSQDALEDQRASMAASSQRTKDERKDRLAQTLQLTQGITLERDSLVRQLDLLRDINKQMRDDQDIAKADKHSGPQDNDRNGKKIKNKLEKQGSVLSNYFDIPVLLPSERTSKSSYQTSHSDDLEVIEDDGIDYDDDVLYNDGSHISYHDNLPGHNDNQIEPVLSSETVHVNNNKNKVDTKVENNETTNCYDSEQRAAHSRSYDLNSNRNSDSSYDVDEYTDHVPKSRQLSCKAVIGEVPENSRTRELIGGEEEVHRGDRKDLSLPVGFDPKLSDRVAPIGASTNSCKDDSPAPALEELPSPARVFKITFVGDSGVGKSSFIHRFCHDQFSPRFNTTIGVDFQVKSLVVDKHTVALQLWDTAGQERFRSITRQYFRKADGVIIMYDVTSETSFKSVRNWTQSVREEAEENTMIMLLGNKTDLVEDQGRMVTYKDGAQLANCYRCIFYETSAKTGSNTKECMSSLASLLKEQEDQQLENTLKLEVVPKTRKCCS